jgi:hypothetical protein
MTLMIDGLDYLLRFLTGENVPAGAAGYTTDRRLFPHYRVVIIPSGFFDESMYGKPCSLPSLPLQEVEGVPLLFGLPKTETIGTTLVVHADIIASAYFLLTRYEEMVRREARDVHGRFPGKESLPYRAGFLHRPVADEYGRLLRNWLRQAGLRIPERKREISKVYLTHDIDAPFLYRSWKGFVRSLLDKRGISASVRGKYGAAENDPYYTFPHLFRLDNYLQEALGGDRCQPVYFLKAGGYTRQDKPRYNLQNGDMQKLIHEIRSRQALIGLHASYQAGLNPPLILKEKETLEKAIGDRVSLSRHHFLACREPEDTDVLETAGITGDFTPGYADAAGFRLGTSRPVRWINPVTRRLSPLVLHPLLIMDCTLKDSKYMGLSAGEAESYASALIEQARQAGGEVTLLWHNTSLLPSPGNYLPALYDTLLKKRLS